MGGSGADRDPDLLEDPGVRELAGAIADHREDRGPLRRDLDQVGARGGEGLEVEDLEGPRLLGREPGRCRGLRDRRRERLGDHGGVIGGLDPAAEVKDTAERRFDCDSCRGELLFRLGVSSGFAGRGKLAFRLGALCAEFLGILPFLGGNPVGFRLGLPGLFVPEPLLLDLEVVQELGQPRLLFGDRRDELLRDAVDPLPEVEDRRLGRLSGGLDLLGDRLQEPKRRDRGGLDRKSVV